MGSRDLAEPLEKAGLPVSLTSLEFGDLAWEGRGNGKTVLVGIEFKQLEEYIASCRSGRFSGVQLPGLSPASADGMYDHAWLLVEGTWMAGRSGFVSRVKGTGVSPLHGRMTAQELEQSWATLALVAGIQVRTTASRRETVGFVTSLYRWWTDKEWDAHRSHLTLHKPAEWRKLNQFQRTIRTLPRVGPQSGAVAEQHFGTLRQAFGATATQWTPVVGPRAATTITKVLG